MTGTYFEKENVFLRGENSSGGVLLYEVVNCLGYYQKFPSLGGWGS